jgi:hypothetical protein
MGFGEYGQAEDLNWFTSLFNAPRAYYLPSEEAELA